MYGFLMKVDRNGVERRVVVFRLVSAIYSYFLIRWMISVLFTLRCFGMLKKLKFELVQTKRLE